jgi:hypothetical protein
MAVAIVAIRPECRLENRDSMNLEPWMSLVNQFSVLSFLQIQNPPVRFRLQRSCQF